MKIDLSNGRSVTACPISIYNDQVIDLVKSLFEIGPKDNPFRIQRDLVVALMVEWAQEPVGALTLWDVEQLIDRLPELIVCAWGTPPARPIDKIMEQGDKIATADDVINQLKAMGIECSTKLEISDKLSQDAHGAQISDNCHNITEK